MQITGKSINPAISALTVGWKKSAAMKTPWPILDCIHVQGFDGRAVLTRTDLETTVTINVPGNGNGLECHLIDGKALKGAIGKLRSADTVTIEGNGPGITVGKGAFNVPLTGLSVDDYPTVPTLELVTDLLLRA